MVYLRLKNKKQKKGQSLFEVVFAIGIAALVLTAIVSLSTSSIRNSTYSRNNAQATKFAQEALEWLRQERDTLDWSGAGSFSSHSSVGGTTTCLGSNPLNSWGSCGPITGTIFNRSVILTTIASDEIDAVVVVTWTDGQGTHEVRSTTKFTDWKGELQ